MGPKARGKRGDGRKVRRDKWREWLQNDRKSLSGDEGENKGLKMDTQNRNDVHSAKEESEWKNRWEMGDEKRTEMQQVGRRDGSKGRINGWRTIGHCIEQARTGDEVFTAAGSSLFNYSIIITIQHVTQYSRNFQSRLTTCQIYYMNMVTVTHNS